MSTSKIMEEEMTTWDYLRRTIQVAVPSIIENMSNVVVGFVDTIMVSRLGNLPMAAVSVNAAITWLLNSFSQLFVVGTTVMVAQSIGAGDKESAKKYATEGLSAGFIMFVIMFIVSFVLAPRIPWWMGATESYAKDAITYLRIYTISIIPMFTGRVASSIIRGTGNTRTPMFIAFVVNVIHLILNFFLIYPTRSIEVFADNQMVIWGAGLGVKGAAISTAFSNSFGGIVLVLLLFNHSQIISLRKEDLFKSTKAVLSKILYVGLPAAGENVSANVGQLVFHGMVNRLGEVATVAHGLANQAESITYMPASGFSVAATTLIGHSIGEGNTKKAEKFGSICCRLAFISGCFTGCILFFFPEVLMRLFSTDLEVIAAGVSVLKIIALIQPIFNTTIILIGVLRGAGDTLFPLGAAMFGMYIVRLGLAYILIHKFNMGLVGAWIGMAIDNAFRFVIIFTRYIRKKWLYLNIRDDQTEEKVDLS